jgi:hypothetical protein
LLATIDVISEEKVSGVRRVTIIFQKAQEVRELTVDVTHKLDGRLYVQKVGLRHAYFLCGL